MNPIAFQRNTGFKGSPRTRPVILSGPAERRQTIGEVPGSDTRGARGWFILAVGSLILAGLFALLLVVGRLPWIAPWITDANFFKRCLIVHVNLSLLIWFGSFSAALFSLFPARSNRAFPSPGQLALPIAATGVGTIMLAAFLPNTQPILSNYIPFIDHRIFGLGIVLFLAALTIQYVQPRLWETNIRSSERPFLPAEAAPAVRVCALATLVAITTFAAAWAATSRELPAESYYELLVFGGGHVLQVAHVAAMAAVWLLLIRRLQDKPVVSARVSGILFGILLLPHMAAPLLTLRGTDATLYMHGSTQLMRWGIFPAISVLLILCLRRLFEARRCGRLTDGFWRDPRFIGFAFSAGMTVLGFVLGAMIRGSSTLIPAHYHASIGAVTVAFMSAAYLLLQPFGWRIKSERFQRLIPWQLVLFGGGQIIFALGFALGGVFGLDRKAYASEQHVASWGEHLGIAVMGVGGLLAMAGGILFLVLVAAARAPRRTHLTVGRGAMTRTSAIPPPDRVQ